MVGSDFAELMAVAKPEVSVVREVMMRRRSVKLVSSVAQAKSLEPVDIQGMKRRSRVE